MKLRFIKSLLSVVIVLSVTTNAMAVDLIDAYLAAVKNDPTFRAARAQYLGSREATAQARAPLLPQLLFNGLLDNQNQVNNNGRAFTIRVTQDIFNWGAFMQIRQARASVRAAAALFAAEEQDLIVRLVTAYFRVVAAQDIYRASRELEKNALINLNATRDRFKHGHATVTDIDQAKASYDQAKAQAWSNKIEEYNSLQALSQITGQSYGKVDTLKFSFPLITPDPKDVTHWVNKSKQGNLFLKSAELSVEAAKRAVSVRKGDLIPVLRAFGQYQPDGIGVDNNVVNNNQIQDFNYGLEVDYNAFEGGITLSQIRQDKAELQRATAEREGRYLSAIAQARSSYNALVLGIPQIKAGRNSVQSSRNALENTRKAYLSGVKTILDILNQQQVLFQAERDYALDRENYMVSIVQLEQASGILSPVTLVGMNQWLMTNRKQARVRDKYLSNLLKPLKMIKKRKKPVIAGSELELPSIAQTNVGLPKQTLKRKNSNIAAKSRTKQSLEDFRHGDVANITEPVQLPRPKEMTKSAKIKKPVALPYEKMNPVIQAGLPAPTATKKQRHKS